MAKAAANNQLGHLPLSGANRGEIYANKICTKNWIAWRWFNYKEELWPVNGV
jgi:hypothetical protein|tara:strand:+ start:129 stop:284 length:156 start_codon:yes stop_codon:yes gene_type:complete